MSRKLGIALAGVVTGLICSSAASAAETITYTYDARGRLIKVVHTGSVNNNIQACYQYDKEGNRINVTTTTSGTPSCP